ncbi:hypothetical protein D9613_003308 [Agrocybe pediades]|uniref:Uncharacterized protein n=1 Tax=Agrocybe pediades TaxID=84607 RepID=A0A8H4VM36_9AGAR|nr:hypothetical protein D9613_003308 [Agrocybe pediades]
MPRTLKYKGLEAWLEDKQGRSIPLYKDLTINEARHAIYGRAHLEPKTSFSLHWRRETGLQPISAICQVFLHNGYYIVGEDDFCVATNYMDQNRRVTQTRSTYSYMNPPYKRHALLKPGRECDFSSRYPKPPSLPSGPCIVRLEIRRIDTETTPMEWTSSSDNLPATVINTNALDITDDPKKGFLPYAIFVFEIPDITQPPKLGTTQVTNTASSSVIQMTLRSKNRIDVPNSGASARNNTSPSPSTSNSNGTVVHCPRNLDQPVEPQPSSSKNEAASRVNKWLTGTTSTNTKPDIIDVDSLEEEKIKDEDSKFIITLAEGISSPTGATGKRKRRTWDFYENNTSVMKSEIVEDDKKFADLSNDLTESYQAMNRLEKQLTEKLKEKLEVKKQKIKKLQLLLASD